MTAVITGEFSVYKVEFPQEQIVFYVDRFKDKSDFTTTAEILAHDMRPGKSRHIHQGRTTLTSSQSKNTLIKDLKRRVDDINWDNLVDETVFLVLAKHREGVPSGPLSDYVDTGEDQYLVSPLLLADEISLLFGDGGTAKSYIALAIAMTMASGREIIPGLTPWTVARPMYLDWETNKRTQWHRAWRLARGAGMDELPEIEYRRCINRLDDEKYAIKRTMIEKDINLLVVDSVSYAAGGDLNEQAVADTVIQPLRWLNATTLCIAHVKKDSDQGKAFGSVFWHNGPRSTFELKNQRTVGESRINVGVFQRKANDDTLAKPFGLSLSFSPNGSNESALFEQIAIEDNPDLAKNLPLPEQIKALLLRRSPLSIPVIAEELDAKTSSVRQVLNRGKGRLFVIVGFSKPPKWGLYAEEGIYG